jgi:membrane-bound lytic murein transglycosylase D
MPEIAVPPITRACALLHPFRSWKNPCFPAFVLAALILTACQPRSSTLKPLPGAGSEQAQHTSEITGTGNPPKSGAEQAGLTAIGDEAGTQADTAQAASEEELRHQDARRLPPLDPAIASPSLAVDLNDIDDPWFELIKSNRAVQAAANEWLTWKRPQLLETWNHYRLLADRIRPAFTRAGIDEPLFLAIMAQESGGRVHSSSRAGAAGLFQLMPATARRLGLHGKHGDYDLRYSPEHAAAATARYLAEQMRIYDNDLSKVLAAYNSGENRFRRINKRHKNGDFWSLPFYYDLPAETRDYVPQVLAAMLIYRYPSVFNVTLPQSPEGTGGKAPAAVQVTLPQAASLSQLAVCLGQHNNPLGWYRDLRNLNHGIRANKDLPAGSKVWIPAAAEAAWHSHCQNQALMTLAYQLHQADFPEKPPMLTYVVRRGDALSTIARKFSCTSRREVARLNKLKAPRYLIRVGQRLKIPRC